MATLSKEISVSTDNKIGTLAKTIAPLKEAGISIRALCAWGEKNQARILVVTENSDKAAEWLKKSGLSCQQSEVVLAELANQPGALAEAAKKIADQGVDIVHCYASVCGTQALAVFSTKNNQKTLKALG